MKRVILGFLAVLCAFTVMPLQAQNAPRMPEGGFPAPTMEGFWQLCTFQKDDKGEVSLHLSPIIKTISADGTYATVIAKTTSGGSMIAESGTSTKLNDSTLVLTPRGPRKMDAEIKSDTVTFHLKGPQWLIIESKLADGQPAHEIWMRLRHNPGAKSMLDVLKQGGEPADIPQMGNGRHQGGKGRMRPQRQDGNNNDGNMDMNMGGNNGGNHWMDED